MDKGRMTIRKRNQKKLWTLGLIAVIGLTSIQGSLAYAKESTISEAEPTKITYSLPKPSGTYNIGTTELHLVDRDRNDFWTGKPNRELMISIWYPAKENYRGKKAPYMHQESAAITDKNIAPSLGADVGQIDWANFETHAWLDAPTDKKLTNRPVVLYSPGFGVPRTAGTSQVEELVSKGYVVITMDHTHETDAVTFPGGRVEVQQLPSSSVQRTRDAMRVREQDIKFVLDQLILLKKGENPDANSKKLPYGLNKMLDLSRIGMFGHSAGGINAADVMKDDKRIDVGINLDGVINADITESIFSPSSKGLQRPFLLMGSTSTHTHLTDNGWKAFWDNTTAWKRDLNIAQGGHYTFTDHELILPYLDKLIDVPDAVQAGMIGTVNNPERVAGSIRTYINAFFNQHLEKQPQTIFDENTPKHPDIELVK
jgi:hypothetical protein